MMDKVQNKGWTNIFISSPYFYSSRSHYFLKVNVWGLKEGKVLRNCICLMLAVSGTRKWGPCKPSHNVWHAGHWKYLYPQSTALHNCPMPWCSRRHRSAQGNLTNELTFTADDWFINNDQNWSYTIMCNCFLYTMYSQ
jgi:hypothetical protein